MYINDLQEKLTHPNVYLYADDTVIYSSDSDLLLAHHRVQTELNHVLSWCELNQLTINAKKTKAMVFGTNNMLKKAHQPAIYLGNSELQYVTSFNYLGIKLDSRLNYELHAQECARQVSHKLYMLTKIRPFINNTQALCLYKSKLLPYFDYGDIFYNKTYMRVLRKLQKLQNRALKLCLGKDARYNSDLLHFEASLPKLQNRRKSHILNFAFHRAHNDQYIRHFDRDLRAGDAPFLYEPFSRCESFKRSIVSQCATHWNALPVNERNIQEYDSFKFKQKQKIIPTIHNI